MDCYRSLRSAVDAITRDQRPAVESVTPGRLRTIEIYRAASRVTYSLASVTLTVSMTEAGLAVFVVAGFMLPVPILVWLDRPSRARGR
jgi:hypothetical protein